MFNYVKKCLLIVIVSLLAYSAHAVDYKIFPHIDVEKEAEKPGSPARYFRGCQNVLDVLDAVHRTLPSQTSTSVSDVAEEEEPATSTPQPPVPVQTVTQFATRMLAQLTGLYVITTPNTLTGGSTWYFAWSQSWIDERERRLIQSAQLTHRQMNEVAQIKERIALPPLVDPALIALREEANQAYDRVLQSHRNYKGAMERLAQDMRAELDSRMTLGATVCFGGNHQLLDMSDVQPHFGNFFPVGYLNPSEKEGLESASRQEALAFLRAQWQTFFTDLNRVGNLEHAASVEKR